MRANPRPRIGQESQVGAGFDLIAAMPRISRSVDQSMFLLGQALRKVLIINPAGSSSRFILMDCGEPSLTFPAGHLISSNISGAYQSHTRESSRVRSAIAWLPRIPCFEGDLKTRSPPSCEPPTHSLVYFGGREFCFS
jgi:hypothetical protein